MRKLALALAIAVALHRGPLVMGSWLYVTWFAVTGVPCVLDTVESELQLKATWEQDIIRLHGQNPPPLPEASRQTSPLTNPSQPDIAGTQA